VKDNPGWVRDMSNGMLININTRESGRSQKIREQKIKEREELDNLKTDVQEIKALLHKLVEKS